jgi:hypothetical protein
MTPEQLPESYRQVYLTYTRPSGEIVTKRAFYSEEFKEFAVPPDWRVFNNRLLPHGFGGDRVVEKNVIVWKYCDYEEH